MSLCNRSWQFWIITTTVSLITSSFVSQMICNHCKSTFANYRRFKWHMNDNRGGVKLKSTLKTLPASAIWVLFKCSLSAFMISFLLQYDPYVYKHCTCQTKQCLQTFLPSRLPPTRLQLLDLENISFLKRTLLGWWSHCRAHITS